MTGLEYRIEQMRPEDVQETALLERQIFSQPWSEQGFLSSLALEDTLYLTVRAGDKLIGYCGLLRSFDEADITNVAVASGWRGKGVGSAMLTELLAQGAQLGIARFTLEVRAGNAAAIHLYEKLGFVSAGIRRNFYDLPKEDAVIMWKM